MILVILLILFFFARIGNDQITWAADQIHRLPLAQLKNSHIVRAFSILSTDLSPQAEQVVEYLANIVSTKIDKVKIENSDLIQIAECLRTKTGANVQALKSKIPTAFIAT